MPAPGFRARDIRTEVPLEIGEIGKGRRGLAEVSYVVIGRGGWNTWELR